MTRKEEIKQAAALKSISLRDELILNNTERHRAELYAMAAQKLFIDGAEWMKEQILKVVQQYADKGYDNLQESIKRDGEDSHIAAYWDGFTDCANAIQREFKEEQ